MNWKNKKIWIVILLLITIPAVVLFFRNNNQIASQPLATAISETLPIPTPAFYDITIPYLREREYKSSLGQRSEVSETSTYTGFLTSYDSDGLKVNALLTIPKGEEPNGGWPAIVFVHGYIPPTSYKTLENYSQYVDYLARSGFVVLKTDLRGHGTSEGDPGGSYYSSDYIIDVLNARAALQASGFVNPQEIGLWGHSMAGNVVSRALASQPDIPAIVIWAGAVYTYSDLSEYGIDDNSYRPPSVDSEVRRKRTQLFETHGVFDPESNFWKQVPMTNYLPEIKGAIQLNHAVNDPVVSIDYSRNLNKILDGTGIEHELKEYPSGGHNFTGSTFTEAMQNTVAFFRGHL